MALTQKTELSKGGESIRTGSTPTKTIQTYGSERPATENDGKALVVAPEGVTTATLNEMNRKFWSGQGGQGVIS